MNEAWNIRRSFPVNTADLAGLPGDLEEARISAKTLHLERLNQFKKLRRLYIWGATKALLERAAELATLEVLALEESTCESLPQSWNLPHLKAFVLSRCPKLTSLGSLKGLPNLETLCLKRSKHVADHSPLQSLKKLRTLELGIEIYYERQTIESVSFMPNMRQLESLTLHVAAVLDDSLRQIALLPRLRMLYLSNTFPREDFAYLAAKLPRVECDWFAGHVYFRECAKCQELTMAMFTGKRQPCLCRVCDKPRFDKKLKEYHDLVASFRDSKDGSEN